MRKLHSNQVCMGCLHELKEWKCVNRDCPINGDQRYCKHNYFSDLVMVKKGLELRCSNCGYSYGLLGQLPERRRM